MIDSQLVAPGSEQDHWGPPHRAFPVLVACAFCLACEKQEATSRLEEPGIASDERVELADPPPRRLREEPLSLPNPDQPPGPAPAAPSVPSGEGMKGPLTFVEFPNPSGGPTGEFLLRAIPKATIYFGGEPIGETPFRAIAPAGRLQITGRAVSEPTLERTVRLHVYSDRKTQFVMHLERYRTPHHPTVRNFRFPNASSLVRPLRTPQQSTNTSRTK